MSLFFFFCWFRRPPSIIRSNPKPAKQAKNEAEPPTQPPTAPTSHCHPESDGVVSHVLYSRGLCSPFSGRHWWLDAGRHRPLLLSDFLRQPPVRALLMRRFTMELTFLTKETKLLAGNIAAFSLQTMSLKVSFFFYASVEGLAVDAGKNHLISCLENDQKKSNL